MRRKLVEALCDSRATMGDRVATTPPEGLPGGQGLVGVIGDADFRIAVVMPLYNGSRYVQEALKSVLAQTRPADEIIVVDDGSTDNGPEIVRAMERSHAVRMYRKENGGQSSARNYGVRLAASDLIAFVDQDDMWYPDHLAELIKPFREPHRRKLGWVYGNLDEVDHSGRMVLHSCLQALPFHHPKTDLFKCLKYDMFVLPSCSLIAKSAFDAVGGFDENLAGYEDDDLFIRLFQSGHDNVFIDLPLTKWRIHQDGCSYSRRMAVSRRAYINKLLTQFPDDHTRGRIISRDCLATRFLPLVLRDYREAVRSGSDAEIREAAADLAFVSQLRGGRARFAIATLMPVLKIPLLSRLAAPMIFGLGSVVRRRLLFS
jgi:glycosyltransferase involved in cell wall biosynthesis